MKHLHKRSGQTFEVGSYVSPCDNRTYDITIISYWKDAEQEKIGSPIVIVGYYFGDYDKDTTDYYIEQWLANRTKEISVLQAAHKYLDAYLETNRDVLDWPDITYLAQSITECNELLNDRSWKFVFKDIPFGKMTRSEYHDYVEELFYEGKIDDDTRYTLHELAVNYEE